MDIDYALPATVFVRKPTDLPSEGEYDPIDFDTTAEAIRHAAKLKPKTEFYISAATVRIDRDQALAAYKAPDFPRA